jgi:beta-lactamase class A
LNHGDETDVLLERWQESDRRSRARRSAARPHRSTRSVLLAAALVGVAYAVTSGGLHGDLARPGGAATVRAGPGGLPGVDRDARARGPALPSAAAVRRAWRFARRRGGQVSLALIDTRGRLRGRDIGRGYVSASVVKTMLLAAELRRLRRERLRLDSSTHGVLKAMITSSDNDAADAIYARVGDAGLAEVARAARMRRFAVARHWSTAQVTAADLARLFARLRAVLPRRHRRTGLRLMASIVKEQRWGLPRAASGRWTAYFKGGWRKTGRGELVHQAAWLRDGGRSLSIAIMTDAQPSRLYAIHTVRGVADRLLAGAGPRVSSRP